MHKRKQTNIDTAPAIVILAAGQGTRMRSELPKVMHQIAHQPMVLHVMDTALALDPACIVTVLGPEMEAVQTLLGDRSAIAIQKERLGTAHAVSAALPALQKHKGPILVLYGDTPLLRAETLHALLALIGQGAAVAVLGFKPENPTGYGRLLADNAERLTGIVEEKDASAAQRAITLCNAGVMAFAGGAFAELLSGIGNHNAKGEYYLTDAVEMAVKKGLRCAYITCAPEEVMGVNDRAQLAVAEAEFQKAKRLAVMRGGVTLQAPETVYFSHDTHCAEDVIIEPCVVFGPGVTLGKGVKVKAFSHIEGAIIHQNAVIGPYARIRPGTDIGKGAKIGNFVEIKKSTLAEDVKVNHLSYIGDTKIGAGSNIGAGTITCNYDGVHKYNTHIGQNVFIGSDVALVAPVTIADGALIAAGSVITEDVPAGALAVARSRQTVKLRYKRKKK